MRVGINLLWVRPGKNGGTESYIRNILDGLMLYAKDNEIFFLYVSRDNCESFEKYFHNPCFEKRLCNIETKIQSRRIVWENLHLSNRGLHDKLDVWLMPVYSRPFCMSKKVPVITVIHDIQGVHYPEYFSKARTLFFRFSWWWDCKTSDRILTISEFCKQDILKHYRISENKIEVIYNPIITSKSTCEFSEISRKFHVEDKGYYYTVSSLAKHKNLITLLRAMKRMKENGNECKLLITGVRVNAGNEIEQYVKENSLDDIVVFTGFVSNEERDCLYDHCKLFLFPSVFEGFGMPPIEAMEKGVPVITTKRTSLYEVTQGKAVYVEEPFDEEEWILKIRESEKMERVITEFPMYQVKNTIRLYETMFEKTVSEFEKKRLYG